jgi:excisionase family DNA binding protein
LFQAERPEEEETMRAAKDAIRSTRLLALPEEGFSANRADMIPVSGSVLGCEHNAEPIPILVTVDEAATMLRIGRTVAYQLMQKGEIRSVKIGRVRRVVASSIREYVMRLVDHASED